MSVPNLIIELKEAMSQNQLNNYKRKFEKFDLVILDELGYVSFDRWEEIFKDTMLTGAIVDRLAHKAHVLDISQETSHRFEETISWLKTKA